jgi:uncharacterized phage protein gp47/JayE
MTFGITPTGFNLKTFEDIRGEVDAYQRLNIDAGMLLTDDTDLGQVNASICLQLAEIWELAQNEYSSMDPETANAWALDQLASLTGTARNKYTKSTVTGQVTLNPSKALPAGSIANPSGRPNDRFVTLTTVPAGAGGTFDVAFEAETEGTIEVAAGQLTEITVAVSGWTNVTNALDAVPGAEPEEDPEFRDKRDRELESSGSTNLDAIIAGISAVTGVIDAIGTENSSSATVDGQPPHSVAITVRGGADADVAEALYTEKAAGIGTFGSTSVTVADSQAVDHTILFTRGSPLTFYCTMTVEKNADWNGTTSSDNIKALIAAYVNSLGLDDDVIYDKVKAAVLDEPGVYRIQALTMDFSPTPTGTIDLVVSSSEYATSDVADISVTAV